MERKIYRIEPVFEERIWGTQRLREKYNYETNLKNIAEVYNVCGMKGHLDNVVTGTGLHLSDFYRMNKDLFGVTADELPIEVCMAHSDSYLSIQIHPDDEYGLKHEGMRGRPEGWVILEGEPKNKMVIGHNAKSKEEFEELTLKKDWDKLFRYVEMDKNQYIHVPAGGLHAFCKDAIAVAFSTNSDITYRLYDFDRVDPNTNLPRDLHIQKVFDNIRIPDNDVNPYWPKQYELNGCVISEFYDELNIYTAGRIVVTDSGHVDINDFMFYVCVEGQGYIEDYSIKAGETLFVPSNYGKVEIKGNVDLMYITYKEKI